MENTSFYGNDNGFREQGDSLYQCFGLELVPGNKCQLNCDGCFKNQNLSEKGDIPLEEAKDYIRQAQESGFSEVAFLGGEPGLYPHIFELIQFTREQKLKPILVTNGILLADEENAQKLEGMDSIVVTHAYFPGGEQVIDTFSGRNGYAELLAKAIENIKKIPNTTVILEMALNDQFFPHAFDFFKYCRENNLDPFIEISRRDDEGGKTTRVSPEQVKQLFERFREYDELNYPEKASHITTPPAYGQACTMPMTGVHIKNFGNGDHGGVYSCCAQPIRHGDLKKESLQEILKSPTLSVYQNQDAFIVGPCKDCDVYDECKGGCRGEAVLRFGCPRASNPGCDKIPEDKREDISVMAPESCGGCVLESDEACSLKPKESLKAKSKFYF